MPRVIIGKTSQTMTGLRRFPVSPCPDELSIDAMVNPLSPYPSISRCPELLASSAISVAYPAFDDLSRTARTGAHFNLSSSEGPHDADASQGPPWRYGHGA